MAITFSIRIGECFTIIIIIAIIVQQLLNNLQDKFLKEYSMTTNLPVTIVIRRNDRNNKVNTVTNLTYFHICTHNINSQ